jgi:hypothetical protein
LKNYIDFSFDRCNESFANGFSVDVSVSGTVVVYGMGKLSSFWYWEFGLVYGSVASGFVFGRVAGFLLLSKKIDKESWKKP